MRGGQFVMFMMILSSPCFAQRSELRQTTSLHFTIQFESEYEDDEVEVVKSELESAYRLLNKKYGLRLRSKVPVYLTGSRSSYRSKVSERWLWSAAYSNGTLYFQPMSYIQKNGGLTITVRHVLAHAMLQPVVTKGCPPWLAKSFAVNFSGEFEILSKPSKTAIKFFADLNEALQEAQGAAELESSYYIVGLAVRYLEERFGSRKIADLFRGFDGRSLEHQVMERVFGLPYNDLQYQWARYVDRRINASK